MKVKWAERPKSIEKKVWEEMFDDQGRGVPVNGYVKVAVRGDVEFKIVTEKNWRERLDHTCSHGWVGWQCKVCL